MNVMSGSNSAIEKYVSGKVDRMMKSTDLYRIVRKGLSEKLIIETHPEQCKGMMAEGIQRYDYV